MAMEQILKAKHSCIKKWTFEGVEREWTKPECETECCCEGKWNEFFDTKPTELDIVRWQEAFRIEGESAKRHAEAVRECKINSYSSNAQLITINIDQKSKQPEKYLYAILDKLRQGKKKKWLASDAIASFEFYGSDGNWNPHLHCVTTKLTPAGTTAQGLNRIFYETKKKERIPDTGLYKPCNVIDLPKEAGLNYINGNKALAKMGAVDKDHQYREEKNIPHRFNITLENLIIEAS